MRTLFFFFSPTALKSPKPVAEPTPAITTPVTVPVVGKKAGIYASSILFIGFFSLRYINTFKIKRITSCTIIQLIHYKEI